VFVFENEAVGTESWQSNYYKCPVLSVVCYSRYCGDDRVRVNEMGGDAARMVEKRNSCRYFVARAEGTINRWEGLRVGFSIVLKFVLKKYAQPVTEMNTKNISWG
jgi:hypothetical protein